MKRIIALLLALVMCFGLFAGCNRNEEPDVSSDPSIESTPEVPVDNNLEKAVEYLRVYYKDAAEKTPMDYKRIGAVRIGTTSYPITWSVDTADGLITVVDNGDGTVTIDINEEMHKEKDEPTNYVLTATLVGTDGREASYSWNHILPAGVDNEAHAVIDAAYELEDGQSLEGTHTLTGVIVSVDTMYSEDYKNITVTIEVPGREDKPIQCYRLKGEGADKLAIGDTITVTGTLKNYKGTIEFDQGCVLEAVESGGQAPVEAPTDPLEILKAAFALAPGKGLPYKATLTGKIVEINYPYSEQYGDTSVTIITNGYKVYCYRLKGSGVDQLNVNDVITVNGQLTNYNGTIEFNGPTLLGLTNYAPPSAPTDPHQIVDEAYGLSDGEYLSYTATLTGVITGFKYHYSEEYQSICVYMTVSGRESKPIYCYNLKGSGIQQLDVGDTITVKGEIKNYMGLIEFVYPTLVSYVLAPEELTEDEKVLNALYELEPGESLEGDYSLTGVITEIGSPYSEEWGNITVTIVVEGHDDKPVVCFRMTGEGADTLAVGDTIKVTGGLTNYNGTYEFTAGCGFELISKGEPETPDVPVEPIGTAEVMTELPVDGDLVVIYNSGNAMTATANGNKLSGEEAEIVEGVLELTETIAQLTVSIDENGYYTFLCGDKYLTSGETGNSLTLADEASDYSLWTVEAATEGTFYIKNVNAKYVNAEGVATNQSLEYYNGFTTYGHKDTEIYQMQILKVVEDVYSMTGPYELYMDQVSAGKTLYFSGEMSGDYLATTENQEEATPVFIEQNEKGHTRFLFLDAEEQIAYIEIYLNENGKSRPTISSEPTMYFTYSEELGIYVATLNEQDYYLGTFSTYETIGASSTYYITGDNAGNVGVSQFVAQFSEINASEPTVNGPYILGLYQQNLEKALYFAGSMDGEYLATTEDASFAVQVFTEDTDEGMRMYFEDGEEKLYIEIYTNENGKVRPTLVTEPTVYFVFDEEAGTYVVDIDGTNYYLGTYGTYATISASKTSYIIGDNAANVGVSQFITYLVDDVIELLPVPETLAEQIAEAESLANGEYLYYTSAITGTIVGEVQASSYDEGSYKFTVEDTDGNSLLCYYVPVIGGTPVEGDTVTVIGSLTAYKGSAQFDKTATAYLEVKIPETLAEQIVEAEALANGEYLPYVSTITGTIIDEPAASSYDEGYYKFTVEDADGNSLLCYYVYVEGGTPVKGDTVTVDGCLTAYKGSAQFDNTASAVLAEKEEEPEVPEEPVVPETLTEQIAEAQKLENKAYLPYESTITGTIVGEVQASTKNEGQFKFTVQDTDGNALVCYYVPVTNGTPVEGDTVTVTGYLTAYNGSAQFDSTASAVLAEKEEEPEEPESYVYGPFVMRMYQANLEKNLFFTGEMSGYYLATSENPEDAVPVYMEYTGDDIRLFFFSDEGTQTFIEIQKVGDYVNVVLTTQPTMFYSENKELGTLVANVEGTDYYLGTYKTYNTISPSKLSYVTGDNAATVGVSNFPVQFANGVNTSGPFNLRMEQVKAGKTLYFAGYADGEYLATTEDAAGAAELIVVEVYTGETAIAFADENGEIKFIEIYLNSSNKPRVRIVDEPVNPFTYNSELGIYVTELDGQAYYLGTFGTYETIGASSTYYITGDNAANVGVSQFVAYLVDPAEAPVIPEEPEVPEEPVEPTAEEVLNIAYALAEGETTEDTYYLEGFVVSVDTPYSEQYGNVTVTICVPGFEDKLIQCFRLKGEGADVLAEGDRVAVRGQLSNYKGKVQFAAGTQIEDYVHIVTEKEAVEMAYALEAGQKLDTEYGLTGTITEINTEYSEQYGNITVTIVVEGCEDKPIVCFRMKGEGVDQLQVGDKIVVFGTLMNYNGTIEFDAGCVMAEWARVPETPEAAPEETHEVAHEETPEVAPEETPEVAPEVAPEETPEVAPEETPVEDETVVTG